MLGGAALAGALLLAPTAVGAAPAQATVAPATGCAVTGGSMQWGVKESFRSYISGSIANGSWEASAGATYETPEFAWSGATGSLDPETGTGAVSFVGTVQFTGHEGVLDLTLSNPTLEFEGDGKASLYMDSRSTDATGALVVDAQQEWVADVTVPASLGVAKTGLELSDLPAVLTNSGAKAFAGFYQAEDELDPISLALTMQDCDVSGAPATTATPEPTAPEQTAVPEGPVEEAAAPAIPWVPVVIGGVAVLVIGITAGMLLSGRKKKPAAETPAATEESPSSEV